MINCDGGDDDIVEVPVPPKPPCTLVTLASDGEVSETEEEQQPPPPEEQHEEKPPEPAAAVPASRPTQAEVKNLQNTLKFELLSEYSNQEGLLFQELEELDKSSAELEGQKAELEAKMAELEAKRSEIEAKRTARDAKRRDVMYRVSQLRTKRQEIVKAALDN